MTRHLPRLAAFAALLVAGISCGDAPTAPEIGEASIAVAPDYANATAAAIVDVEAIRIRLFRPGQSAPVVEQIITIPTGQDSVELRITVPMRAAVETFDLVLTMWNAVGDTVFRAGPIPVTANTSGTGSAVVTPTLQYVGVGANATGVRFVNPPGSVSFGGAMPLVGEAFDAGGATIVGAPVGYELVTPGDSIYARIPDERVGSIIGGTTRRVVPIRAFLAGGQTVAHSITVQPVPASLTIVSGNNQTGPVGAALAAPLVARVLAADALPVRDVMVDYVLRQGVTVISAVRDTSDVNGDVNPVITLGSTAGTYTVTATVVGTATATAVFNATATAGAPTALAFVVQPSAAAATQPIAPAMQVAIRDGAGNTVTTATNTVTIAIAANAGGDGVLSGTLSAAAVNGIATFPGLSIQRVGTGYTLSASAATLTSATSALFNITVGAATQLAFGVQPPAASPGAPFTATVQARDAGGNPVTTFAGNVTVALGANPTGATLGGTLTVAAVGGTASFTTLTLDNVGTGYTLAATSAGLGGATSNAFDVTAPSVMKVFVNPAGGLWSSAANWSGGTVPSGSDTVLLTNNGTYTVTLDAAVGVPKIRIGNASGAVTLLVPAGGGLTLADSMVVSATSVVNLSGGNIGGPGAMAVAGTLLWDGGTLQGPGITQITPTGGLIIQGTALHVLNGRQLLLGGAAIWSGAHTMNTGQGARLEVMAGTGLDISGDPTMLYNLGGAPTIFTVSGVLSRSTSTGVAVVTGLEGAGDVAVLAGTLEVRNDGVLAGTLTAGTGATLRFAAGTHTLTAASTLDGTGQVEYVGGNTTVQGIYDVTGTTRIVGGIFNLNAAGSTGTLNLLAGDRGGSGTLSVVNAFNWSGGDFSAGGGTTSIVPTATMNVTTATTRVLTGQTLEIAGTATWSDAHQLSTGGGAIIRILPSATMNVLADLFAPYDMGGVIAQVQNQGILRFAGANGTSNFGMQLVNPGTVDVQAGSANFSQGGSLSGSFTIATSLGLGGGSFVMTPTFQSLGGGVLRLTGGALDGLAAGDTARVQNLTASFGQIQHLPGSTIRVNGTFLWDNAAAVVGGGSIFIAPGGFAQLTGTATRLFGSGSILDIGGTGTRTGTFQMDAFDFSRLRVRAGASYNWSGGGSHLHSSGGVPVLENLGTFTKSGANVATLGAQLIDSVGTGFQVTGGELVLAGGGRIAGAKTLNGGALTVAGGTLSMSSTTTLPSIGATAILRAATGGTISIDSGATLIAHRVELTGGTIAHEGLVIIDTLLTWQAGTLRSNTVGSGGTTRVAASGGGNHAITGAGAKAIIGTHTFQTIAGTTVNFTSTGNLVGQEGASISSSGIWNVAGTGALLDGAIGAAPLFINQSGATLQANAVTTGAMAWPLNTLGAFGSTAGSDTLRLSGGSVTNFIGTGTFNGGGLKLVGGTFTLSGALSLAGTSPHLAVGAGALDLNGQSLTMAAGNFSTSGTGALQSTLATSSLSVNNATFAGAASTPSGGNLLIAGSFAQLATTSPASFQAGGTHRVQFVGPNLSRTIAFASPATSRFHRMFTDPSGFGAVINFSTDATIGDSLIVNALSSSYTVDGLNGNERITVNGIVRVNGPSTGSGTLSVPTLIVSQPPSINNPTFAPAHFAPDTIVLTGAMASFPVGARIQYRNMRVSTSGAVNFSVSDTITGSLEITSGAAAFIGTSNFLVSGNLSTSGTGLLLMSSFDANLTVNGSATFAGASTNGQLTNGSLTLRGAFTQGGGNTAAFSATGSHTTRISGTAAQVLQFANPGTSTTTSHFQTLNIVNSSAGGTQFNSPIFATGQLTRFGSGTLATVAALANGDSLVVGGVNADSLRFQNVPLRILGTAALTNFSDVHFSSMDATRDHLIINIPAGTFSPNLVVFNSAPNAGVYNVVVNNTGGTAATVSFFNSSPLATVMNTAPFRYQRLGGVLPVLNWNSTPLTSN